MRRRARSRKKAGTGRCLAFDTSDPRGMGARMADYLEHLAARQMSEPTRQTRASGLRQFAAWCSERGVVRVEDVTRSVVEQYQRWIYHHERPNGQRWSVTTQLGKLHAVRGFFGWLARTNRIVYNPASDLELPRMPARLPRDVLTAEEAERVLSGPDTRTALGLRDRAILEVLYSTGMRRGEAVGLDLSDVDARRGVALIREGKGKKDRVVPVGERALSWVARYLAQSRPRLAVESTRGPLFVTETGERMSAAWLTDVVRGYVERSGVKKTGACHLFRHTCATLMLEGGADIRFIQQLLGHAALSTTEIYTRVSIVKLCEIHRATHPARLEGAATGAGVAGDEDREALLDVLDEEAGEEERDELVRIRRSVRVAGRGEDKEGVNDNRDL